MKSCAPRLFLLMVLLIAPAAAQTKSPSVGYLYPAGAQRGTVVHVLAGGQVLRGASSAHVSGEGIKVDVLHYYRPLGNIQKEQRDELMRRFKAAWDSRLAEQRGEKLPEFVPDLSVDVPDNPMFDNIANMSLRELEHLRHLFATMNKRQKNAQLAESVLLEVSVDADAKPGERHIRLITAGGITNPMKFCVGAFNEVLEYEPNDPQSPSEIEPAPPAKLPCTFNGQIMPGDVDRFRVSARRAQHLCVQVEARALVPYLADAVPGWFQPVVTVYDAEGDEVAFADDNRFDPDPLLSYKVPDDGVYTVEIRDSVYRGREDFVYRMTASTDAAPKAFSLPKTADRTVVEQEANDTILASQRVALNCVIEGRFQRPGDSDFYRFEAAAGEEVVLETHARRLGSPTDTLLRLFEPSGNALGLVDDSEGINIGMQTHQADSYLRAKLPASGTYSVEICDAQRQGGSEFQYRLRIGEPRPDFDLYVCPSGLYLAQGMNAVMSVHVVRKDGFDGPVDIALNDTRFKISGGRIPGGCDSVRVTLKGLEPTDGPVALQLEGRAKLAGKEIARTATPCEDMMQAFAYRHLVPAPDLVAVVAQKRGAQAVELPELPLRVAQDGCATLRIQTAQSSRLNDVRLQLNDPPKGISLGETRVTDEGLAVEVKADGNSAAGYAGNLIIDAYMQAPQGNKPPTHVGTLPAIPFEIIKGTS